MENNSEHFSEEERINDPFRQLQVPPELEHRVIQTLKKKGLIAGAKKSVYKTPFFRLAASVILFVSFFIAGWWLGQKEDLNPLAASKAYNEYILLLYNPENFAANDGQIAEYTQWFETYSKEGYLQSGNELSNEGLTLEKDLTNALRPEKKVITGPKGYVSGFFIIQAPTEKKANEIASSCPHLKYNGVLELRAITY